MKRGDIFITRSKVPYELGWRSPAGEELDYIIIHLAVDQFLAALEAVYPGTAGEVDVIDFFGRDEALAHLSFACAEMVSMRTPGKSKRVAALTQLLAGLALPLVLFVSSTGFVVANSITGALADFQADFAAHCVADRVGAVSALVGAIQYGSGILSSALVGSFADGTPRPMGWVIALAGIGSLLCALLFVPARHRIPHDASRTASKRQIAHELLSPHVP